MIISVASGKGGTGKTTIAINGALSVDGTVHCIDCDAEEPNAHIFLKPTIETSEKVLIPVPDVDEEKCTYCGRCKEVCAYNAITVFPSHDNTRGHVLTFSNLCHGCGACAFLCPEKAIKEVDREIGIVESGYCNNVRFTHGKLNIGEAMAPPVIRQIKRHIDQNATVIIDAPPGTSCPVVSSIQGSDYCILVTEPTPFGFHDLTLAVDMVRELSIPFGVVINRADVGNRHTEDFCRKENISILMRIPFEKRIAVAYSKGVPIVEAIPEYRNAFRQLFKRIEEFAHEKS